MGRFEKRKRATAGRNQAYEVEKKPTKEEIAAATEQKAARAILLNSASSELTSKFKDWWKQGNYIFRFQADGENLTGEQPVISQIEQFAKRNEIELNKGWKVDLSRNVKQQILKAKTVPEEFVEKWIQLFKRFDS